MSKLDVDKDQIRDLALLLQETGLSEIEICEGERRLHLVRHMVSAQTAPAAPAAAAPAAEPAAGGGQETPESYANRPGAVASPMVGTVYRAPEPGAAAFVEVGDRVSRGQTLLIIEAMKTFNEIPAPCDGAVTRIFVENGTPVEFGEILMLIE